MSNLTVFLMQSPRTDRYYFTAQSFESQTIKAHDGTSFTALAPRGNNDTRNLPENSVTSKILPIEWSSMTRAEVVAKVGETAKLDPISGDLTLIPLKK